MIKKLKSNKLIILFLLFICIIFVCNPAIYTKSAMNAISVWAFKLLPAMFPFFIITRIIVNLVEVKTNVMDKFFYKLYHTRNSSLIYFLSILSGYPMGAKLISNMYDLCRINNKEAKKMLSFCSVSGPMFIVGSVGVGILHSYKAGLIILIANILASLLNGLIYRGKEKSYEKFEFAGKPHNENLLLDSVFDAIQSILMVCGFIVVSFLLIDMLKNLKILNFLAIIASKIFKCDYNIALSCFEGTIEMTRGIIDLSNITIPLSVKAIISSTLIAFGGVSILLQSLSFLAKLNISKKTMIVQKTTQALLCLLITIPLALIFLK